MSEGIPYADIVILALIAIFILLRLRSVLGNKNEGDLSGYFNRMMPQANDQPDPIVQVDEKSLRPKPREEEDPYLVSLANAPVAEVLHTIKGKDPLFTATRFLAGARGAYEMVFDAFAKGDRQTLKMLLSEPLSQDFSRELDARTAQENKAETTLVSVTAKDIIDASLNKNVARLGVSFLSEQITLVRNAKGDIIEGDPSAVHHIEDHWVFERDVTSKNPNWKIVET